MARYVDAELLASQIIIWLHISFGNRFTTIPVQKTAVSVKSHQGFRFIGDILQEFQSLSVLTCTQKCLSYSACRSTNVFVNRDKPLVEKTCQLLSHKLTNKDHQLTANFDWIFTEVKVSLPFDNLTIVSDCFLSVKKLQVCEAFRDVH